MTNITSSLNLEKAGETMEEKRQKAIEDLEDLISLFRQRESYLKRQTGKDAANTVARVLGKALELLKEQQQIVRCKYCKNRRMVLPRTAMSKLDVEPYCKILRQKVDDDFYCASGCKRETKGDET